MQLSYTFSLFSATVVAIFGNVVSEEAAKYIEEKWLNTEERVHMKVSRDPFDNKLENNM